jgi:hypothetical protein
MRLSERSVRELAAKAASRQDFWVAFLDATDAATVAEVGVYRGDFAARLLGSCRSISRYYLIDPWRHLDDWNKPANKNDDTFETFYREMLDKTAAHAAKRVVLRGRTADVVDQIADGELDFVYVDGDHTLRGITIDLLKVYPKVREGGWIGGDDFCRSIFQHPEKYEPTLVFPYAVYFAEAVGARIFALPHKQFLMEKVAGGDHEFVDVTGRYRATTLKAQLDARRRKDRRQAAAVPAPRTAARRVLRKLTGG